MNKIIPFTVFCSLIMIAVLGNQPEVVGVMDPVATYSGMTTLCEAGSEGAIIGFDGYDYIVYAIPFPRPPGYTGLDSTYDQSQANVMIQEQEMDDDEENTSYIHYVGSNITGCEAWVSLVPREDIGVPFQGSSLTGENIDSGGNFEAQVMLAVHMADPLEEADYMDDFSGLEKGKNAWVWDEDGFLFTSDDLYDTQENPRIRYFMNKTTIVTDDDPASSRLRLARLGIYTDLSPMPLNCDMMLIMVPKNNGIKVFDPTGNEVDYNDNANDDCVQVLWGVAVYYDVSVPFSGRGVSGADDESPVSIRAILKELLAV